MAVGRSREIPVGRFAGIPAEDTVGRFRDRAAAVGPGTADVPRRSSRRWAVVRSAAPKSTGERRRPNRPAAAANIWRPSSKRIRSLATETCGKTNNN